jgi:hypothetical protein
MPAKVIHFFIIYKNNQNKKQKNSQWNLKKSIFSRAFLKA